MIWKMVKWRAPSLRFILIAGAFLLFVTRSISQIHVDLNCQQAYRAVISLRFSEVHAFIALEKKADPENLFPVYLENYIDFLTLVIGEEKKVYKQLKEKKSERLKLFEKGYCNDPFYTFCHGEIHLQWALIHIKFGDYTEAAFEIHKAHELFSANESRYPTFLVNKIGMGMIHVMLSLIPTNYKWVSHLLGLRGSMDVGLSEIRQVTEYAGTDKITLMYKPQSSFFLSFLVLNLQKNKTDAMDMLQLLENQTVDGRP